MPRHSFWPTIIIQSTIIIQRFWLNYFTLLGYLRQSTTSFILTKHLLHLFSQLADNRHHCPSITSMASAKILTTPFLSFSITNLNHEHLAHTCDPWQTLYLAKKCFEKSELKSNHLPTDSKEMKSTGFYIIITLNQLMPTKKSPMQNILKSSGAEKEHISANIKPSNCVTQCAYRQTSFI